MNAGVMYWYQTQPGGAIFTAHYKYLSFIGGTIVSGDNAVGNQAIFDHSTFQYMGTIAASNAFVINAAYKQSASVGANRLLQVTNNTFRYCSRVVGFTGRDRNRVGSDPAQRQYHLCGVGRYFRTYTNMTLQAVDLKKLDFTAGASPAITDTAPGVQMASQFHSAGAIASGAVEKTHADR